MTQNRPYFILTALVGVSLILLFQNCGTGEYGLYGSRVPPEWKCVGLVCEPKPDNLWLESYVEYKAFPYQFQDIAGDCNSGEFPGNVISFQAYRTQGSTDTEVSNIGTTTCDAHGRYRARVNLCSRNIAAGHSCNATYLKAFTFFVAMKIQGQDLQGTLIGNSAYPRRADVDVVLDFID